MLMWGRRSGGVLLQRLGTPNGALFPPADAIVVRRRRFVERGGTAPAWRLAPPSAASPAERGRAWRACCAPSECPAPRRERNRLRPTAGGPGARGTAPPQTGELSSPPPWGRSEPTVALALCECAGSPRGADDRGPGRSTPPRETCGRAGCRRSAAHAVAPSNRASPRGPDRDLMSTGSPPSRGAPAAGSPRRRAGCVLRLSSDGFAAVATPSSVDACGKLAVIVGRPPPLDELERHAF
jgi:hypothetical protein